MSHTPERPGTRVRRGSSESAEDVARRLLKRRGVWSQFCHWSYIWRMMPTVAYRLSNCLTAAIPDTQRRGPLLGQCYVEAARVIERWAEADSTRTLVADAVAALFTRAADAAAVVVVVGDREWRPREDGPLGPVLSAAPELPVATYRRESGIEAATADLHALFREHVYCSQCERSLGRAYDDLFAIKESV
ncbi:hypothetical protein [Rhodanobacter sp. FW106-PBR-R2A-1-13]|uniref:hypothetical protein n=1 Tax=Rhodanobacter sp. FW106-PBR-R2A-1-13 TaxID=3454845 RepID=UPI0034E54AE1